MPDKNLSKMLLCVLIFSGCMSAKPASEPLQKEIDTKNGIILPTETGKPQFAESRPRAETRDELTVTFTKSEVELDFRKSYLASEAQLYTAIYEGLFSYHPFTMEPVPAVAERWDLSEDKKQWTFTIRQTAKFQNGDPVTAQDFRASWLSTLSPQRDAPYSSLFDIIEGAKEYRTGAARNADKVGIIASGERTLVVKLNAPAFFFPSMLCHHSFSTIHPSMLNARDWSATRPVSNGPYYINEMNDTRIVFAKANTYWDASAVSLNKITIRYAENGDEASSLWNSGESRWISGDVNFDTLTDRSGIQVNAMFATHYYFIRSHERPWNDFRIRRALVLALPWDEIRAGHFLPAKTLIYPLPGYPELEGLSDTKIEEAVELLSKAGFPGGRGLPELVIRITPSQEAARISGLMASTWKDQLGVPVRVEVVPYNRYFQMLKTGGYTIGFSTWIGDFADPYTFLQMWRRDSNLNDAQHSDDDYESLMEKSMLEEGQTRWAILADAEKLLLERGSVLPISYSPAVNIIDTGELGGWFPNALDIHPFKYISFKAFRPLPGVAMAK